jgi:hypothetical protein
MWHGDIVYLLWGEGGADRPLAKLNGLEMKKFVDEARRMYEMPVSAEEQLEMRKQEMASES